ncbi:hypothetical protein ABPG74_007532 [Tetrahymena malaccensis]
MPQSQQGQSNQQKSQEAQSMYFNQSQGVQPYGAFQSTIAFGQEQRNRFQTQNNNQQQLQNCNYNQQNFQMQRTQFQASNVQQNQFYQQQDTFNAISQYNQQNEHLINQNNQVQSQQQNINRTYLPNINNQNSIQSRSDSQKPFDRPKRDHSKNNNAKQQTTQNKNQAQALYQVFNNTFQDTTKDQILQKINDKVSSANKNSFQQYGINNRISNLQSANQQLLANNSFKVNQDQMSLSQSQLKNNSQFQQNTNSLKQEGLTNYSNIIPQANQNNFQKSFVSQHNNNYPVSEYSQNSIQKNNANNMMNQQADSIQNVQSIQYNQQLQQQNYMQQSQQSFQNYQENQNNKVYQTNQLQQQQQQQQQQQNLIQYRNLPTYTQLIKKKEQAQVSELDQPQLYNQQAQNNNLSVIQEQQFSEISQSQTNQSLNQSQLNQQYPSEQETNNQTFKANQIDQQVQNQQNQIFTPQVNQDNQQSNNQNQKIESPYLQTSAKQCQNNFDQNQYQIEQQQNSNLQQDSSQVIRQNEKQRNEQKIQPKYLSYENQDSLSNNQVKNIEENNGQIERQQDKKQLGTDPNAQIIEVSHSYNETQKHKQLKEAFQFLTKQQIESDYSIIEKLAEQLISQETQQNIQQLQIQVDSKDLDQIYNFDVLKNAIDKSVEEFKFKIDSEFKGMSNIKLFDCETILDQYQLPQDIYEQCFDELKLMHSGILAELLGSNREKQQFETQINKEICKNMLLQYLHYAQMNEIIYCVFFKYSAIQELTYDKLNQINANQQTLKQGKYQEKDDLKQSFNICLDQIKEEIKESINKKLFDSTSQDSLEGLKNDFRNKKQQLIKLINDYWKLIRIKNVYETDLFSIVITYKKIQIIYQDLNQLLEQSQESLNSFVNEILFKQNNTKINVSPIETQISENFLLYVKNDANNVIQKLKKKQDRLFEIAYCKYEETLVNNYFNNQRALEIHQNLVKIENYTSILDKISLDTLKQLFQKQIFMGLFKCILFERKDSIQINFLNMPQLLLFLIRFILQRVLKKTNEIESHMYRLINVKSKHDYIEEYFNSNLNIPFFTVKFIPNAPSIIEENTIYAKINIKLELQEFTFKISNHKEIYQYKTNEQFNTADLKDDLKKLITQFDNERQNILIYFFRLEQSHKCGILAMYLQEKFETISSYIEKKREKSLMKDLFNKLKKKDSKCFPFIKQMSFTNYQQKLQNTYQLTLDFIESIKIVNISEFNSQQQVFTKQQSEFKQYVQYLSGYDFQNQFIVFQDQKNNPQILLFKNNKQQISAIFFHNNIESFQKNQEKNIQVVIQLIFDYKFQKMIFFSLLNDFLKENKQFAFQFYQLFIKSIDILKDENQQLQFEYLLNYLIDYSKEQSKQNQLNIQKKQEISFTQQHQQLKANNTENQIQLHNPGQITETKLNNYFQLNEAEKNKAKNTSLEKLNSEQIQNQINKIQLDQKNEIQFNQLSLGYSFDEQKEIQHEEKKIEEKYYLENFLGLIQEESFKQIFNNNKKKFNLQYLQDQGYIDEIIPLQLKDYSKQKIVFYKEKSCLYLIGNLQQQIQILISLNQKQYIFYQNDIPQFPQSFQIEKQIQIKKLFASNIFENDRELTIFYILIWLQDQQRGSITQQTYDKSSNIYKYDLHLKYIWLQYQQQEKYRSNYDKFTLLEKVDKYTFSSINQIIIYLFKQGNTLNYIPLLLITRPSKSNLDIVFVYDSKNQYQNQNIELIKSNFRQFQFSQIEQKFKNIQQQKQLINLSLYKYLNLKKNQEIKLIDLVKQYFQNYNKDICFPFKFIQEIV